MLTGWGGAVVTQLTTTRTVIGSIHSQVQKIMCFSVITNFLHCRKIVLSGFQLGPTLLGVKTVDIFFWRKGVVSCI